MALKGQLSDFNLAEILQLIAGQRKSGFLIVEAQREMVFVFDDGVLISTRDRRSEAPDPLEIYLRTYGFFDEAQWKHIEFVKSNSSLDLTEIMISEELMEEEALIDVLRSIALEMTHRGMKLRRGRYHFTATKDTPTGVRGRFEIDVQALLMEAARRLDEEPLLLEAFPSQAITFAQGPQSPPAEGLSDTGRRVLELALAGFPLGRIVRNGRADSFTVRELLREYCEEGYLEAYQPGGETVLAGRNADASSRRLPKPQLRSLPLTVLIATLAVAFSAVRWAPLALGETSRFGLAPVERVAAAPGEKGASEAWNDPVRLAARDLRLRQLRTELTDALELYRFRHGRYPQSLSELVARGYVTRDTARIVTEIGWSYGLLNDGRDYSLET
jgi:hypothetical protein